MTYHFFVASIYMYIHQSQMYFKRTHIIYNVQGVGSPSLKLFTAEELKGRLKQQLQIEQQVIHTHIISVALKDVCVPHRAT